MIPGSCDEFTQPEEIEALSKFLGNVRKAYDDNTKLEEDKLGVYGRSNLKDTEALSKNLDRIGISQKERFTQLSKEVDKIKGNKEVLLSNQVENLKDQRNSRLEEKIEKLILGGNTISSLSAEVELLAGNTESDVKLSETKTTFNQSNNLSELSRQVERIKSEDANKLSSTKQELRNTSPNLESLDSKLKETLNSSSKINLTSEKVGLKTNTEVEVLSDNVSRINGEEVKNLSSQVEGLGVRKSDSLELVKRKKKDTTKHDNSPKQKLSDTLEKLKDKNNIDSLSKSREDLLVSSNAKLVTEKDELRVDNVIENLGKRVENLENVSGIKNLSSQVSRIKSGAEDELTLTKTPETLTGDRPKNLKLEEEKERLISGGEIEKLEKVEEHLPNNNNTSIQQLSDQVDKITDEKEVSGLSSYYETLQNNKKVNELSSSVDKLSLDDSIKGLSKDKKSIEGEQKKVVDLSSNIAKIDTNEDELRLSAHRENLENTEKVEVLDENPRESVPELGDDLDSLGNEVDHITNSESAQINSLADQVSERLSTSDIDLTTKKEILEADDKVTSLSSDKKGLEGDLKNDPELESEVIEKLEPKDNITSLVSEKEKIVGQASDDNELSGKVITLDDSETKVDQSLSSVVKKITDDTKINLSEVKESISPKEDQDLSEKREVLVDNSEFNLSSFIDELEQEDDLELSERKEKLVDENESNLSNFVDKLKQKEDSKLSSVVEEITDDTKVNLSEVKESISPKEDQDLSEILKSTPENSNTNKWSGALSGKRLDITKKSVDELSSKVTDAPKDDTKKEGHEKGKFDPNTQKLSKTLSTSNKLTKKEDLTLSQVKKSTPSDIVTDTHEQFNPDEDSLYDTYVDINGDSVSSSSENTELDEDFEVDEGSLSSEYINAPKDSVSNTHKQFDPNTQKLAKSIDGSLDIPSAGRKSDAQELESSITRISSQVPKDDTEKEGHEEGRFDGEDLYDSILGPTEEKSDVENLSSVIQEKNPGNKNISGLDSKKRRKDYKTSKLAKDEYKSYKEGIIDEDKHDTRKIRKPLIAHHKNNPDGTVSTKNVSTFQSSVIDAVKSRIKEDSYYQKILKLASIVDIPDNGTNGTPGLMAKISSLASAYLSGGEITKERYVEYEAKLWEAMTITKEVSGYQNTPINQGGEVTELKGKNRSALGSLISNTGGIAGVPSTKLPAFNLGAINLNNYLRFTAEKSIGNIKFLQGTARKILLDETLDALIYARDVLEKLTKANRDRLPGNDNGLLSSAVSGGLKGFATAAVGAIFGGSSLSTDKPLNRPKTKGTNSGREGNNWEERDSYTALSNKFESCYSNKTGGRGKEVKIESRFTSKPIGIKTTIEDLCGKNMGSIKSVENLMSTLEESPYITTASKFTSTSSKPYKVMSLDSNNYWEIIFEPFVGEENGNKSYLPSINEINKWNMYYHDILTDYTKWLPILSFDLSKSKMTTKTLGLFDGEISYPVSMEFTNELKLTFADDQYKSLRTYFERCVDASIYSSEVHNGTYYETKTSGGESLTKIDKTYTHVAFYKNVTFRCIIYSMTPQKSTVSKYDLLVVIKDFTEERSGEIEGGGTDLTVSFSIVGENPNNVKTLKDKAEAATEIESWKLGDHGEDGLGSASKVASVAKKMVSGVLRAL